VIIKLPRISGEEVIRALSHIGYVAVRQRGSHVILAKQTSTGKRTVVVPLHDEIDIGTLKEILRQADVTREEFLTLL
jgi:predicted RNA binding protein YcfA (HicA-like mRNA interferase family)